MKLNFIGQGLNEHGGSIGETVIDSLNDTSFHTFSCFIAFVSVSGIDSIAEVLENSRGHINAFNFVVGVDQKGTSELALRRLLSLNVDAKVYFTTSPVTFHPKLYLFRGNHKNRLIIGSGNFTESGLFHNVEASIVIDFEISKSDGQNLIKQVDEYFSNLISGKNPNVQLLTDDLIEILTKASIVPSKNEDSRKGSKLPTETDQVSDIIDRLKKLFPSTPIQKLPDNLRKIRPKQTKLNEGESTGGTVLIWSKKLTNSDALVKREGTSPTGGLRLTQAGYEIDQTKFFRYDIFGKFDWNPVRRTPYVEVAKILFDVRIQGKSIGQFRLDIRYKPTGEAHQHNYTTSISWGRHLGSIIRQQNLSGKMVLLYEPLSGKKEPFLIEIA